MTMRVDSTELTDFILDPSGVVIGFAVPGGFTRIGGYQDPKETNLALIKQMADAAGYRLVKKRN